VVKICDADQVLALTTNTIFIMSILLLGINEKNAFYCKGSEAAVTLSLYSYQDTCDSTDHSRELPDSSQQHVLHYRANLSGAVTSFFNTAEEHSFLTLKDQLEFRDDHTGRPVEHHYRFYQELSFNHILDSTWLKGADVLQVQMQWSRKNGEKRINTLALNALTSMLPAYRYEYLNGVNAKIRQGGFMNPGIIEAGAGYTWNIFRRSRVTFTFATLALNSFPISGRNEPEKIPQLFTTRNSVVRLDYGCAIQTSISEQITPSLRWENYSSFFGNGLDREHVRMEVRNNLNISIHRQVSLLLCQLVTYQYVLSSKVRWRNEIVLTYLLEKKIQ
jgi:hypothetical protein